MLSHSGLCYAIQLLVEVRTSRLDTVDAEYDAVMSPCFIRNAKSAIADSKYRLALRFLDRAIASNWVTGEAFALKGYALMRLHNSDNTNREALSLFEEALKDEHQLTWVIGQQGLCYLRLGDKGAAVHSFEQLASSSEPGKMRDWARGMLSRLKRSGVQN